MKPNVFSAVVAFPHIIGAIDCTHVQLEREHIYRNCTQTHSIMCENCVWLERGHYPGAAHLGNRVGFFFRDDEWWEIGRHLIVCTSYNIAKHRGMLHDPIPSNARSGIFLMSLWRYYLFSFSYKRHKPTLATADGGSYHFWTLTDTHRKHQWLATETASLLGLSNEGALGFSDLWLPAQPLQSSLTAQWWPSSVSCLAFETTARASHLTRGGTVDVALISCATWTQALSDIAISNLNLSAVREKSRSNRNNSFLLGLPTNQLQPVQIEANALRALSAAGINAVNAGRNVRLSV